MPHAALKLIGGVNQSETQALNEESGLFSSNLIRFFYDPNGVSLVQKLGGWQQFYMHGFTSIPRALWAWEDLNLNSDLAVGCETDMSTGSAQLSVITNGTLNDVTPSSTTDNIAPVVQSTMGSPTIQITDTVVTGVTNYNSVYITTQISIGGVVLFGLYACDPDGFLSGTAYTIYARDILGNLLLATSSSSSPVLPSFTTTATSLTVSVNLPNYTYHVGDSFPVLTPTTVGGITFYGNYVIQQLVDANNFLILGDNQASSTTTGTLNGGLARFVYSFGIGALPGSRR